MMLNADIKRIFMYSGQGSQYFGMGQALYENIPEFKYWLTQMDEVPKKQIGVSIVEKIFLSGKGTGDPFDRTLYTHPATFMVELALTKLLMCESLRPDIIVGASLGDYVSSVVSGAYSCEEVLTELIKNAQSLEEMCSPGFMLSILADHRKIFNSNLLSKKSTIVSINNDNHFVVAGDRKDLPEIIKCLDDNQSIYSLLPVKFGFHSPNIDAAIKYLSHEAGAFRKVSDKLIWISCLTADEVKQVNGDFFNRVAREPILFRDAVMTIKNRFQSNRLVWFDLGPSGTLRNMLRNILPKEQSHTVITPMGDDLNSYQNIIEKFCVSD